MEVEVSETVQPDLNDVRLQHFPWLAFLMSANIWSTVVAINGVHSRVGLLIWRSEGKKNNEINLKESSHTWNICTKFVNFDIKLAKVTCKNDDKKWSISTEASKRVEHRNTHGESMWIVTYLLCLWRDWIRSMACQRNISTLLHCCDRLLLQLRQLLVRLGLFEERKLHQIPEGNGARMPN